MSGMLRYALLMLLVAGVLPYFITPSFAQTTQPASIDSKEHQTPEEVYRLMDEGLALHRSGRIIEAAKVINRVDSYLSRFTDQEKNSAMGLVCVARWSWYSGEFENAKDTFAQAVQVKPTDARVHLSYGDFLMANKQLEDMITAYEQAYKLDDSIVFLDAYLEGLMEAAEYDRAWDLIQAEVKAHADDEGRLALQGKLANELGYYEEAEECYRQLMRQHSKREYWLGLAEVYRGMEMRRDVQAFKLYSLLYRMDSNDTEALIGMIGTRNSMGHYDEAQKLVDKLYTMKEEGKYPGDRFIREIIRLSGQKVYVYEYFKLDGEMAVKYDFQVLTDNRRQSGLEYRFSLGSYEAMNQAAREEGKLKEGERVYHLDFYGADQSHRLLGSSVAPPIPTYQHVRRDVLRKITMEHRKKNAEGVE